LKLTRIIGEFLAVDRDGVSVLMQLFVRSKPVNSQLRNLASRNERHRSMA